MSLIFFRTSKKKRMGWATSKNTNLKIKINFGPTPPDPREQKNTKSLS
ncbi:protein of unknown function [Vibrio tapetis subsp. tapetis]|uniref:Uncharacterized protein n=1 Tax=Vibrio tapetis subsp. tapetis TaxID=1671868 RepID=A0A2N8ZHS1_9VIBR|nr:protein of unknown function [Vibrio tapetis subsp. tapetis]